MAMFVILGKFTDQGVRNARNFPQMVEQIRQQGEQRGIKRHGWYLTQGQYDYVVITEAPDAETMAAFALDIAGRGNTRTETLRAYPIEEIDQVLGKMA
jgi:uncharacterized protein with GYD domain